MSSPSGFCASNEYRFPEGKCLPVDIGNMQIDKMNTSGFDFLKANKPQIETSKVHSGVNNSISSLSSESTVCEHSSIVLKERGNKSEKNKSTDTLVDDTGHHIKRVSDVSGLDGTYVKSTKIEDGKEHEEKSKKSSKGASEGAIKPLSQSASNIAQENDNNPFFGGNNHSDHARSLSLTGKVPLIEQNSTKRSPEFIKRPSSVGDCKLLIEELSRRNPHNYHIITPSDASKLVKSSSEFASGLSDLIIIDLRCVTDYASSRIKGSVNFCISSTLLKRPNYSLVRCMNLLPLNERLIFQIYQAKIREKKNSNSEDRPRVLLYDSFDNSSALYFMSKKFVEDEDWGNIQINILNSKYADFNNSFKDQITLSSSEIDKEPSNTDFEPLDSVLGNVNLHLSSVLIDTKTPTLSNFHIPKTPTVSFKVKQLEDDFCSDTESLVADEYFKNKKLLYSYSPSLQVLIPSWIKRSLEDPRKIQNDFLNLEMSEKQRLLNAFSVKSSDSLLKDCNKDKPNNEFESPILSHGLEFGHKNRYKDIVLYEHSRVRLDDSCGQLNITQSCDYINASYIKAQDSILKTNGSVGLSSYANYIATQGPLQQTVGDFWKLILNHKSPLIISLTDEYENGTIKCSPFWKPGVYNSNSNRINVELVDVHDDLHNSGLILRRFKLSMDNLIEHEVIQIHLLTWQDMGTMLNLDELISLIYLKHYILSNISIKNEFPTVIHCSAGCGRTGTFCTIDTVLGMMYRKGNTDFEEDPIYKIVDRFRKQRISMVQNLGQYYLIYETILAYIVEQLKSSAGHDQKWRKLQELDIIQRYIKSQIATNP